MLLLLFPSNFIIYRLHNYSTNVHLLEFGWLQNSLLWQDRVTEVEVEESASASRNNPKTSTVLKTAETKSYI